MIVLKICNPGILFKFLKICKYKHRQKEHEDLKHSFFDKDSKY